MLPHAEGSSGMKHACIRLRMRNDRGRRKADFACQKEGAILARSHSSDLWRGRLGSEGRSPALEGDARDAPMSETPSAGVTTSSEELLPTPALTDGFDAP